MGAVSSNTPINLDAFAPFEELGYAVLVTDAELSKPGPRVIYANPAFTVMTGWPREEIVGRTPRVLQGPETDTALMAELKATLQRGERWHGEAVNYRRDGTPFVMKWSIAPERDRAGTIVRYVAIQEDVTERRRVARREARYRAMTEQLMAAASEGVIMADAYGRIVRINEGAEAIFGWRGEEVQGQHIGVLLPDRLCRPQAPLELNGGCTSMPEKELLAHGHEVKARHRDGRAVPVTATVGRLRDPDGDTFIAVARDLSREREQQRRQAASERRFRALFDHALEFIALLSLEGEIVECNRAALDFRGLELAHVRERFFLDTPWFEHAPEATLEVVKDAIERAAAGAFVRDQIEIRAPSGETRTFDFSVRPLHDDSGAVDHLIAEGRDITDIMRAARATKRSERRLREAQRIANVGDWSWDIASNVLHWSDQTYVIFGYTPRTIEPTIELVMEAVHPDDRSRVQDAITHAQTAGTGYSLDYRICRADGAVRSVHETCEVLFNPQAEAVALVGILQDVTDWKAAQSALVFAHKGAEVATEAKTRFMAMVGHELRTPINAITGFAEMLAGEFMGPLGHPKYRAYAGHIVQSGRHLLALIERMLDTAHLEDGKRELSETWFDLNSFLRETLRALRTADLNAVDRIELTYGPPLRVFGDATVLRQVLINLVDNAAKFTPADGRISVAVELQPDGSCALTIRDEGPGIPEHEIQRMLLPFVQRDDGLDRKYEGVGLGLYLAKTFLELHGGRLRLHCPAGGGTVAQAVLPPPRVDPCASV